MPRTTCYDEVCEVEDKGSNYPLLILWALVAVGMAAVILNNASLIGIEMLNNPLYPGY